MKALEMMEAFRREKRLDYDRPVGEAKPEFQFQNVFSGKRGHMFGVLEGVDERGRPVTLRAFSSLHGGLRYVPGWAPSILPERDYEGWLVSSQEGIKRMTKEIEAARDPMEIKRLVEARTSRCRALMRKIHDAYHFRNFRGEERPLREVFLGNSEAMPGGVGDCCAPKLLNQAVQLGIRPLGLAEFFWGGENASGRKQPGQFFSACEDKCQPILGFLLCGLEDAAGA
ncbi:MAG: hypothetical protein AAF191_12445 [Verrucomicrobiota bacterium]